MKRASSLARIDRCPGDVFDGADAAHGHLAGELCTGFFRCVGASTTSSTMPVSIKAGCIELQLMPYPLRAECKARRTWCQQ